MTVERQAERDYLLSFVQEAGFDQEIACDQLLCLWTAYCLHHNVAVDTREYDTTLYAVWETLHQGEEDPAMWCDYGSFDRTMARYLT